MTWGGGAKKSCEMQGGGGESKGGSEGGSKGGRWGKRERSFLGDFLGKREKRWGRKEGRAWGERCHSKKIRRSLEEEMRKKWASCKEEREVPA